jgi:hypothetical protein
MKTAIHFFTVIFLVILSLASIAQDNEKEHKNFVTVTGALIGPASATSGVEYERFFITRHNYSFALRVARLFRYHEGNANLCFSEGCGSGYSGISSHWQTAVTGYYFPTRSTRNLNGFFLHGVAGVMYSTRKDDLYKISTTAPGFELGLGFQFRVANWMTIRWLTSWGHYNRFTNKMPNEKMPGGILAMRCSIGF